MTFDEFVADLISGALDSMEKDIETIRGVCKELPEPYNYIMRMHVDAIAQYRNKAAETWAPVRESVK